MKNWVVPVIVLSVVLFCVGFGVIANFVLQREAIFFNVLEPEWEALYEAQERGVAGYEDLQELMVSATEDAVASSAGQILVNDREGIALFLEAYPECGSYRQDDLASSAYYYDQSFWQEIAVVISGDDDPARDGAELFVRIAGTRYKAGGGPYVTGAEEEIAEALIDAIPRATGDFADNLAYTISLYNPTSFDRLVDFLDHEDAQTRRIAVATLGRLGVEEERARIEALKHDSEKEVRVAAYNAIDSLDVLIAAVPPVPSKSGQASDPRSHLGMPN